MSADDRRTGLPTLLVTGATGQAGLELARALTSLGRVVAPARAQMDLADADSLRTRIRQIAPDVIVNAAAYTAVDQAQAQPELALRINAVAPGVMAEEAKRRNALLIHYSTDYVFDGANPAPYTEADTPHPLGVYGQSKLAGEQAVAQAGCAYLILRTSWLYSARRENFVRTVLKLAREKAELAMVTDQIGAPTWARALARSTAELLAKGDAIREQPGIFHLCAQGHVSRYDFAHSIIATARDLSHQQTRWAALRPITTADYPRPAARPLNAALSTDKIRRAFGVEMPHWREQLRDFLRELL